MYIAVVFNVIFLVAVLSMLLRNSYLSTESEKLHQDLQKVEQLEAKITQELEMLKTKIPDQKEQLEIFSDLDKVRADGEIKKKVF